MARPNAAILRTSGVTALAAASCASSGPRAASGSREAAGSRPRVSSSRTRTSSPGRATPPSSSAATAPNLAAHALAFDPHDDIAILRVPGLNARPLTFESKPKSGTSAAILGYPLDGPFDAQPGRIGSTQVVNTEDAYGKGPVQRSITSLRGLVRPGNSGGPMVDADGQVAATVFAAITGAADRRPGGFAVPDDLVRRQLSLALSRDSTVATGQCSG